MELELFLIQHPELEINLEELSLLSIEDEPKHFSNKNGLKKNDSDLVSENQFISYVEKQMTFNDQVALEKSCENNPSLSKELKLYQSTIAKTDATIIFKNKHSLKRKPKVIWLTFSSTQYVAAACVVFVIGLFTLWPKTEIHLDNSNLATKTSKILSIEKASISNTTFSSTKNEFEDTQRKKIVAVKQQNSNQHLIASSEKTSSESNSKLEVKDTIAKFVATSNVLISSDESNLLVAQNTTPIMQQSSKFNVQVITENDDEPIVANPKKKGLWTAASRVLSNLNKVGIKSVNGSEEDNKDNTAYGITLGGVSINHKAGL